MAHKSPMAAPHLIIRSGPHDRATELVSAKLIEHSAATDPLQLKLESLEGQLQRLRTPSQASSPRSVALPQLPSSSTCLSRSIIWYTDIRKFPVSYTGLSPHNNHARAARTHVVYRRTQEHFD